MSDEPELDIEPRGESLDGAEPHDLDDAAQDAGEMLKAKRPKPPKKQGRRGKRDAVRDTGLTARRE